MLALSSSEAARRSAFACLPCSALAKASQGLLTGTKCSSLRTGFHQRKHSSSKASNASKDEGRAIASTAKGTTKELKASAEQRKAAAPDSDNIPRPPTRKAKAKESLQEVESKNNGIIDFNVPSVPSTQRIEDRNILLASFFSQHRPISVSHVVPPPTTGEAFASIFAPAKSSFAKGRSEDVIETLSSAVSTLENAAAQEEKHSIDNEAGIRQQVAQVSSGAETPVGQHFQTRTKWSKIDLENLMKDYRPFAPPPPPVALDIAQAAKRKGEKAQKSQAAIEPKHATYTSTLTVYETSYPDGNKTYQTYATPIVRSLSGFPSSTLKEHAYSAYTGEEEGEFPSASFRLDHMQQQQHLYITDFPPPLPRRQGYLERLRDGQLGWMRRAEIMHMISVKRQRKLKMKKHKHKKLLKRTRNLRRKLEKG